MALPRRIEAKLPFGGMRMETGAYEGRRQPGSGGGKSGRQRTVRDRLRSRLKSHPRRLFAHSHSRRTRSKRILPGIRARSAWRGACRQTRCAAALAGCLPPRHRLQSRADADSLIVIESEGAGSRANRGLSAEERARRLEHIHAPTTTRSTRPSAPHGDAAADRARRDPFLHAGLSRKGRPWQVGIVFGHDRRLADHLIQGLGADPALSVGVNEPYSPADQVYYTVGRHAGPMASAGRHDRNPQRRDRRGRRPARWADRLAGLLPRRKRSSDRSEPCRGVKFASQIFAKTERTPLAARHDCSDWQHRPRRKEPDAKGDKALRPLCRCGELLCRPLRDVSVLPARGDPSLCDALARAGRHPDQLGDRDVPVRSVGLLPARRRVLHAAQRPCAHGFALRPPFRRKSAR